MWHERARWILQAHKKRGRNNNPSYSWKTLLGDSYVWMLDEKIIRFTHPPWVVSATWGFYFGKDKPI